MGGPLVTRLSIIAMLLMALLGCDLTAIRRDCDPKSDASQCPDNQVCAPFLERCVLAGAQGAPCDDGGCQAELICGPANVCVPPLPEGKLCAEDADCTTDLRCACPDSDFDKGVCLPPGQDGDPCDWSQNWNSGAEVHASEGCDEGFVCVPRGISSVDDFPVLPVLASDICDLPGVCRAEGTRPRGASCLQSAACESGRCVKAGPPRQGAGTCPGFDGSGVAGTMVGGWPGFCAGPEDGGEGAACAARDCAPGLACSFGAAELCEPAHQRLEGALCGPVTSDTRNPEPDLCAFGLVCAATADAWTCQAAPTCE